MKVTASKFLLLWATTLCGLSILFGAVSVAHADISQPTYTGQSNNFYYNLNSNVTVFQNLGAGFSGEITEMAAVVMQTHISGANLSMAIYCYTDDFYLTGCGKSATTTDTFFTGGDQWATTTLPTPYTMDPTRTYRLAIAIDGVNSGDDVYVFGTNLAVWGGGAALPGDASAQGTVAALAFNLSGNNFFGDPSGASFGDISTSTIAGDSLFGEGASSTLALISERCSGSNIFAEALCSAFSFMFLPSTETLEAFTGIPEVAAERFPFSWIYGVKSEIESLSVSSTTAMTALAYNYANLGIGSTTPMGNILPNIEVFSKNTIETYISPGLWANFQTLIAAGMWLSFFFFEFNRARRLAHKHT